ncbi:MAG: hypothetical protein IPJ65_03490 [Archangiaceae bacterium]|nr:hypothetical protein [Archangiaceae bacterium]
MLFRRWCTWSRRWSGVPLAKRLGLGSVLVDLPASPSARSGCTWWGTKART